MTQLAPSRSFALPSDRASSGAADWLGYARCLALGHGDRTMALQHAEAMPEISPRVVSLLKAAISAGSTSDPGYVALVDHRRDARRLHFVLAQSGAFDRVMAAAVKVPLETRIVVNSANLIGDHVNEAAPKPVHMLSLAGSDLPVEKVSSIVVLSEELVRSGAAAQAFVRTSCGRR